MNIVEVNGEKYIQKETKPYKMSPQFMQILAAGMMISGGDWMPHHEPERPKVDIVKEYELILQKKSNLTKSGRDWVEHQFKMNFTKIKTDETQNPT